MSTAQHETQEQEPLGVLVAVDGSPEAATALDWALREAHGSGLPLTAVLAWEPTWRDGTRPGGPADVVAIAARKQAEADGMLAAAVERVGPPARAVRARAVEVQGPAAPTVLDLTPRAETVVLGRRGLGRLGRAVLGSVSSAVAQQAVVPVTIVRDGDDRTADGAGGGAPDTTGPVPAERPVLVGVDGSATSVHALRHGAAVAARTGRPLDVVLCWQIVTLAPLPDTWGWTPPLDDYERYAEHTLATVVDAAGLTLPSDRVRSRTVHAPPARGLLGAAEGAERLVVGNRGVGGFDRLLLGSVSRQVVEHAPCPVTVVRLPR